MAVSKCSAEQAEQVMAERLGHDEDYGFDYTVEAYRAQDFRNTRDELHADDVRRGAVHVNAERWKGRYCVIVPDPDVTGRWLTIQSFTSVKQAEAYAAGYCAHRDGRTGSGPRFGESS